MLGLITALRLEDVKTEFTIDVFSHYPDKAFTLRILIESAVCSPSILLTPYILYILHLTPYIYIIRNPGRTTRSLNSCRSQLVRVSRKEYLTSLKRQNKQKLKKKNQYLEIISFITVRNKIKYVMMTDPSIWDTMAALPSPPLCLPLSFSFPNLILRSDSGHQ